MSRRYTVTINLPNVQTLIKKTFRSNVVFCEAMGRGEQCTWVSDWKRNKNLPSPEEAARMCVLLNAAPEDILLGTGETEAETEKLQADIALVRELLSQQRTESAKKERPAESETPNKDALIHFIMHTDSRDDLLAVIEEATKRLKGLK